MTAPLTRTSDGITTEQAIKAIQDVMIPYKVSMIKTEQSLQSALGKIVAVKERLDTDLYARDSHDLLNANEVRNMALIAQLMIQASLLRRESRGFNFREDYPKSDNSKWLKWIFVERMSAEEGNLEPKLSAEIIPTPILRPIDIFATPTGVRIVE